MSTFTIGNASNIPLNIQTGSIPNMGGALLDWFQNLTFGLVTKTTTGYQVEEIVTDVSFWGLVQPLTGRALELKPEGQRMWNWICVYAQSSPHGAVIDLKIDDVVIFLGTQYRVMADRQFSLYSYIYYELVEDYSASGPPTP